MKSGLQKPRLDHRDFDNKSFGTTGEVALPASFDVDAGLWMPDQNAPQAITGLPDLPAMPYGCTDYTQSDLCADADGHLYNPLDLENITHANARGGADIRDSLKAAIKVFGRTAYFNIRPSGIVDAFDAARLAMYSAQPEKRAISVGSIWYPQWEIGTKADGILQMPPDLRLNGPWHNWTICGWTTLNGVLYLKGRSWQGPTFGDKGFHYISREVFNSVMGQPATVMFTLSKTAPAQIERVDLTVVQTIVSYIRYLLGL